MSVQRKFFIGIIVFYVIGTFCLAADVHQVAREGDLAKLKTLIEENSDLANAKNESQETPLHNAVSGGHLDIVDFLIAAGADVDAQDNQKRTALHLACYDGRRDIVEKLISHGAAVNSKDDKGHSPLHMASSHGHKDIAELLVAKGADVNVQDENRDTALHGAAWKGEKEIVELLIVHKAHINAKNKDERTPLDNALRQGHTEVAELLMAKGGAGMQDSRKREANILTEKIGQKGIKTPLKFTILYDNYLHKKGTKPDWGFSCLIEGAEKTILFDTGTNPEILMHNIGQLEVDLKDVEQVMISHNHHDHTGGLNAVLEKNHEVSVYLPVSFPYEFVRNVEAKKARVISVDEPVEICQNVYSTGEMGDQIKEQSLILNTDNGLIIVTGCSHQGIVAILKRAKELFDRPIHLVFGGFHLGAKSHEELEEIIRNFKEIGVEKCGATHCTGDEAIEMFKEAFGENYVPMGTGRVLEVDIK